MKKKSYLNDDFKKFYHGGDYNPEQWIDTKEIWDEDMRLMKLAHCNEITVGMFSWAALEPREGEYDFAYLDEIVERTYSNGGRVIMCTPSGARPHWLADKYPEVLRVDVEGRRQHFSARHNHCFTSPAYREKVRLINTELAKRYAHHPAVVGWHISNEYGGECYCPLCQQAFREFLKNKYGTIENLNKAYWAAFWSHTYDSFDQIEAPAVLTERSVHGLNIDWFRFTTAQTVDFMKCEVAPIKEVNPDAKITTNMMFEHYGYDYYKFRDVIDFASWDSYPLWHSGNQELTASSTAFWHDFYRTLKGKPFLLMESTPSLVNWHEYNKLKRPGLDNLASIQAVAHGSDSVQYFQWRKSRGSTEKFHGAVVDHEGSENTRVFRSVAKTGEILEKIEEIAGTGVEAQVAIIYDWENMWALDDSQGFAAKNKKYYETCYSYHRFFWKRAINCDIVDRNADLSKYKLVIAPMLYMVDERTQGSFESYVKGGGTLYATYALGMVNETDLCYLGGFPAGKLKEVFGIWNEEIDTLYPGQTGEVTMDGQKFEVRDYSEIIHARGAKVLATYSKEFYAGEPAATVNEYGKGKAYYQAFRDCDDFKSAVLDSIANELKLVRNLPSGKDGLPFAVSAHTRTDGENLYLFVENYSEEKIENLDLGDEYEDMLNGGFSKSVTLAPYGLAIFRRKI
ncbi:MAG: beta-galactosidase [Candidatus Coproplasma sp.]